MTNTPATQGDAPEWNRTGHDFSQRQHLHYTGPIYDLHAHVTMTAPSDQAAGPAGGAGAAGSADSAARMLDIGQQYHVIQTVSMCPPQDIVPLRERLGDRIRFNGMINKKPEEPDSAAIDLVDRFLEAGIEIVKLWAAPRGRDRGLTLDPPWRIAALRHAIQAGIRIVMVHVGDPDRWFETVYTDSAKYGTKADQYIPLRRLMQEFSDCTWIGAHMGGSPENPEFLQELFESHPNFYVDTSATKWQVREISKRTNAIRALVTKFPDRFFWGTDLVTRHPLPEEHYESRYWCMRTLWESDWVGPSPIADPDHVPQPGEGPTPTLRGLALPTHLLQAVYTDNAVRLLQSRN
ncbi:amidohydrolase family protein [Tuwongella immobilis]|uniref:Amidohydrolase-related domain-containing protein n=1 Tax=Tuwongella immobilis TaxID=692036 RepID=A0A6C2YLV0_9BACT|nr:amidohydrolase family protein [Tuwongella immobilis]VIP02103.1 amidohydrolase : Uncharacterized protein OS=Phycisphaera mikurensis (strain NBRC 102666 / KCTC 22515 / FYK2301M01) GN=PSMK_30150 PE=4 SV=1: Amidohydro_2 [Tuwongella immobilis]VTS00395.1 amidohydrolase : Uncharacterized protein OS=Phycisphaera mikurensis (strain NBRC 102666 / KCTC 22515 / FYK2301M01) GN=PSMK_30150 PE=4 SV=1: Amidohydro_2 [Tuwongella immobilis]